MKKIISVSRRTDVPAFYGEWFLKRIEEGFVGYLNPFNNNRYIVLLKNEDVAAFVFWSKNFIPFTSSLKRIKKLGYNFYFNYTINNYPSFFEPYVPAYESLVDNFKKISDEYSPLHINWRYDPVVISDATDYSFHLENFKRIASVLAGHVERCIMSFVCLYGKVKKNFNDIQKNNDVKIIEPEIERKVRLAGELSEIAESYNIKLYSCCCDYLINEKVEQAHCVDGELINKLFFNGCEQIDFKKRPTRDGCGCTESIDIGVYNACAHGCIYCYANVNKKSALEEFKKHDKESPFLGYPSSESRKWLDNLEKEKKNTASRNISDKEFL